MDIITPYHLAAVGYTQQQAQSATKAAGSMNPSSRLPAALQVKRQALERWFAACKRVVVAFSGGVDSSLVAWLACRQLGQAALAVTSASASLKRSDLNLCRQLTRRWGLAHRTLLTDELLQPAYRANGTNRCYFCKRSLFMQLTEIARQQGNATVLSGTNADDGKQHRPGLRAAAEFGVRAPLAECDLSKAEVRALAHFYGVETADKPQAACLASRVAYGLEIDTALLARIERAEAWLHSLGLSQLRVRHHGDIARIEILPQEWDLLLQHHQQAQDKLRSLGWRYVTLDLQGFRSGSMNESLHNNPAEEDTKKEKT